MKFLETKTEFEVVGLLSFFVLPINLLGLFFFITYGLYDLTPLVIWIGICVTTGSIIGLWFIIHQLTKKV